MSGHDGGDVVMMMVDLSQEPVIRLERELPASPVFPPAHAVGDHGPPRRQFLHGAMLRRKDPVKLFFPEHAMDGVALRQTHHAFCDKTNTTKHMKM